MKKNGGNSGNKKEKNEYCHEQCIAANCQQKLATAAMRDGQRQSKNKKTDKTRQKPQKVITA